jgi:NitT/TauT family transport system substrate-binding protein
MKKFYALLMAAVMTLSLVACGSSSTTTTSSEEVSQKATTNVTEAATTETTTEAVEATTETQQPVETVKLNVAYMPNYASLWSVLTAIDKGYFEEEGLDITLWEFEDGPSEIAAMEGGSIDLAYIGNGAHKLCIKGRAVIFAPSQVDNSDKIIVLNSHGITSLEDLAGKKIAYNAGTTSETELNSALSVTGLTFDDIEPYEMEPSNIVAAMTSGSVDACTTWNPYSSQILESVEDAQEIEFTTNSVNMSSWICLPDYAKENRDILVRFNKAIFKAMQYSSNEDNWDYAIGLYATQCAKDKEACQVETSDATWFSADDVKNYIADGTMQDYYTKQQQTFIDNGDVESEVPLDDYILFDVMEDALQ